MESESIWRPRADRSPNCPRCGSANTKFCYYNNYSLTQPRYFCKGCRRYWTKGGSLRNVPVGGSCRKSRRHKSSNNANNNGKFLTSTRYNGVEDSGRSTNGGGGGGGGGPNIDLALVYANFLNPKPENSKNDELPNGSDQGSVEFVINPHNTNPSNGTGMLVQVENPNCSPLGLSWSTEIIDHHHQILYSSGFEEINDKNQERIPESDNYGLPPLPGEEMVCVSHHQEIISSNFVWSSSEQPLTDNHHIIAPALAHHPLVQEPVVQFGDDSEDPTSLLFEGWSFDFTSG